MHGKIGCSPICAVEGRRPSPASLATVSPVPQPKSSSSRAWSGSSPRSAAQWKAVRLLRVWRELKLVQSAAVTAVNSVVSAAITGGLWHGQPGQCVPSDSAVCVYAMYCERCWRAVQCCVHRRPASRLSVCCVNHPPAPVGKSGSKASGRCHVKQGRGLTMSAVRSSAQVSTGTRTMVGQGKQPSEPPPVYIFIGVGVLSITF